MCLGVFRCDVVEVGARGRGFCRECVCVCVCAYIVRFAHTLINSLRSTCSLRSTFSLRSICSFHSLARGLFFGGEMPPPRPFSTICFSLRSKNSLRCDARYARTHPMLAMLAQGPRVGVGVRSKITALRTGHTDERTDERTNY